MRDIKEAIEKIQKNGTGRYRYQMLINGIYFYSAPLPKDPFVAFWELMIERPELTAVQYEDKMEYTPGNHIWQTF